MHIFRKNKNPEKLFEKDNSDKHFELHIGDQILAGKNAYDVLSLYKDFDMQRKVIVYDGFEVPVHKSEYMDPDRMIVIPHLQVDCTAIKVPIHNIIDGKAIASSIRAATKDYVSEMVVKPRLAVIIVGEDPASKTYVKNKSKACEEVGIRNDTIELPESTSTEELISVISNLNNDDDVDGILVQLPLPQHIDEEKVINTISPEKDVDGFTYVNTGKLTVGSSCFVPCTPAGIIDLIKECHIETAGKNVVVIGRSNIVGKPIATLLSRKEFNATVTLCHTGTKDLVQYTKDADIVIVATGHPNTLTGNMIKDGAVVIDVGINRIPDDTKKSGFRLVGDVDYESCVGRCSAITPVPGGVGPMTIAELLKATVYAYMTRRSL